MFEKDNTAADAATGAGSTLAAGKKSTSPATVATVLLGTMGVAAVGLLGVMAGTGQLEDMARAAANKPEAEFNVPVDENKGSGDNGSGSAGTSAEGGNGASGAEGSDTDPSTTHPERPGAPTDDGVGYGPGASGTGAEGDGSARGTGGVHLIERGETLARISAMYGVSVDRLVAANDIVNPNMIYAGSALQIPRP